MDFTIRLPRTQRGHTSMLVILEWLTKMAHFILANEEVKTLELARLFVEHTYRLYGLLTAAAIGTSTAGIVNDRDSKFNSHFWRAKGF